jgi:F0F1-type ATP synthase delta subunit
MTEKKIEAFAKGLLKKSLSEDKVDPQKVEQVIVALKKLKPTNLLEIYRAYLNMLELRIEYHTAYIETPFKPEARWAAEVEKEIMDRFDQVHYVQFIVNEGLIAGLKVQIADMVYENSFKNQLEGLRKAH